MWWKASLKTACFLLYNEGSCCIIICKVKNSDLDKGNVTIHSHIKISRQIRQAQLVRSCLMIFI